MTPGNKRGTELNKERVIGTIISLVLTAIILYFLLRVVDFSESVRLIREARKDTLILAFGLYCLVNLLRVVRLRSFAECQPVKPFALGRIVAIHTFSNMVLPSRLGELTLPAMLRRWHAISLGEGASFLVLTRIYDFLAMAITLLAGIFFYSLTRQNEATRPLMIAAGVLLIFLVAVVSSLKTVVLLVVRLWTRWIRKHSLEEKALVKRMSGSLERICIVIGKSATRQKAIRLLFTSFGIWTLLYGIYYFFLTSFGYTTYSLWEVIIGSTGGVLAGVLPINTTGSWGTLEAGWSAGFYLVGMPVEDGLITGFAQHTMLLIFSLLMIPLTWAGHLLTREKGMG